MKVSITSEHAGIPRLRIERQRAAVTRHYVNKTNLTNQR